MQTLQEDTAAFILILHEHTMHKIVGLYVNKKIVHAGVKDQAGLYYDDRGTALSEAEFCAPFGIPYELRKLSELELANASDRAVRAQSLRRSERILRRIYPILLST